MEHCCNKACWCQNFYVYLPDRSRINNANDELTSKTSELEEKSTNEQKYKDSCTDAAQEIELLKDKISLFDSERQKADDKWQSDMEEKDGLIQELTTQIEDFRDSAGKVDTSMLSEMQERIDFLEEAYETLNEEKSKVDEHSEKLKEKISKLNSERTELYETQISIKEQL